MTYDKLVDSAQLDGALTATADAIRAKTSDTAPIAWDADDGFAAAVEGITAAERVLVSFKDYDGTLLQAYTLDDIQALSALPSPPTHDGLTFMGWSKTFDAIKNYPCSVSVFPKYKVTDGKTRIWISFTSGNKAPTLRFSQSKANGVLIDWGDGSSERVSSTGNVTKAHTYAGVGAYVITLTPDSDCTWAPNWGGSSNNTFLAGYSNAITKVEFGDNVSVLGDCAFYNATNMSSVLLPEGVDLIPTSFCFGCSSLRHVQIPSTVTKIGSNAFANCISLQQLDIPDSVTTIYSGAFSYCHGLKKAFISKYCTNVCVGSNNAAWLSGAELTSAGPYGSGKAIEFSWDALPNYAFNYNQYLSDISFPHECTIIPNYAFYNCSSLRHVQIPSTVTKIGSNAFNYCVGLTEIRVPDSVTAIDSSTFNNCGNLEKLILPESLLSFAGGNNPALSGCFKLKTATPAEGGGNIEYAWVESIPPNAFAQSSVEEIAFPEGLKTLSGFYGCKYLKSIVVPDGVKTLNSACFQLCTNLESVGLPDTVTELYSSVFSGCSRVSELILSRVTSYNSSELFVNMISLVHIQMGSVGYGVTAVRNDIFRYTYNPSLVIDVYTVSNYVDTILASIRNGAVSAKIVVKASANTTYKETVFSAGDIIVTSEVSS